MKSLILVPALILVIAVHTAAADWIKCYKCHSNNPSRNLQVGCISPESWVGSDKFVKHCSRSEGCGIRLGMLGQWGAIENYYSNTKGYMKRFARDCYNALGCSGYKCCACHTDYCNLPTPCAVDDGNGIGTNKIERFMFIFFLLLIISMLG